MRCALRIAGVTLLLAAPRAWAADYSVAINIDDEDDISQLYSDGEITANERDRLLTLFRSKVDLDRAGREALHELPGFTWRMADLVLERRLLPGGIGKLDDIADLEGMTHDIMEQIRPFVIAPRREERRRLEVESKTGVITRYAARAQEGGQNSWDPAFYERVRARAYDRVAVGLLVLAHYALGNVYGASTASPGLSAEGYALRATVPGFYALWDGPRLFVLGGTYRVGYGLRLVMDTTRHLRPHGPVANDDMYESSLAGKYAPIEGFTGLAVEGKYLTVGRGWLDLSAFGSWRNKDIYAYDLRYRHGSDPFLVDSAAPDEAITYATLPGVVRERLVGGNATYAYDRRNGVGLTGYYGDLRLTVDAPDIQFAAASKHPESRNGHPCGAGGYACPFGAVGANVKVGWGWFDAAAEVAVNDVGKPAVLGVAWIEPTTTLQVVPSLRYYSPGYDNPYAHSESAVDEYFGNRARDELGPRLRASWRPWKWLRLHADADLWRSQSAPVYDESGELASMVQSPSWNLRTLFRLDAWPTGREHLAVWFSHHDQDLGKDGHSLSFYPTETDRAGGMRLSYAVMLGTLRPRRVQLAVQFKHVFEDTGTSADKLDQSWHLWLRARATLWQGSVVSARLRYYDQYIDAGPPRTQNRRLCDDEDIAVGSLVGYPVPATCRGESYLSVSLQALQRLWRCCTLKVRTEWQHFTDSRAKWAPIQPALPAAPVPVPTRDELLIKGYFAAQF
jgi:hypothetical protein